MEAGSLMKDILYVNKRIHRLVRSSNELWKEALGRMCFNEPQLWQKSVTSFLNDEEFNESSLDVVDSPTITEFEACMDASCKKLSSMSPRNNFEVGAPEAAVSMRLFRYILSNYIKFTSPVFVMQGEAFIGEPIHLHLFEPRYRILVRELVEGYDMDDFGNVSLSAEARLPKSKFPKFVYAYQGTIGYRSPACVVELQQCTIYGDGRADVTLVPCAHVWITKAWERPNSGNLYFVRCLRMGKQATNIIETGLRRHRRYWINNQNGMGEENHWVEGGVINGRRVRGSIQAILAFYENPLPQAGLRQGQNRNENDEERGNRDGEN